MPRNSEVAEGIATRMVNAAATMALAVGISIASSPDADAQDRYDTQTLFKKGAWFVDLTHDTSDGELWCSAETYNRAGQTFSVTAYQNGQMTIFVFDADWNIPRRSVRFIVDVDYDRWTMDGTGDGIGVSITPDDPERAFRFLSQLMEGSAVAVMNANERRLAVFSLNGSYAAISELFECYGNIKSFDALNPSDPFTGASDPFN